MSGFKTDLFVSPLSDGRRWRIVDHPFVYDCGFADDCGFAALSNPVISVPVGFITDFASIPRVMWDCYPPWGEYGFGAVIHDFLYTTQPFTKDVSDHIFLQAMKDHGVSEVTREIIYHAVKTFGFEAWRQHSEQLKKTRL